MKQNLFDPKDTIIRVACLGDEEAKQSVVIHQFATEEYKPSYPPTIGINMEQKAMLLDNRPFKLVIFDLPDDHRFYEMHRPCIKTSEILLFFISAASRNKKEKIDHYLQRALNCNCESKIKWIVFTKIDELTELERLSFDYELSELREQIEMEMVICSAKNGVNIDTIFMESARHILVGEINLVRHARMNCLTIFANGKAVYESQKKDELNYALLQERLEIFGLEKLRELVFVSAGDISDTSTARSIMLWGTFSNEFDAVPERRNYGFDYAHQLTYNTAQQEACLHFVTTLRPMAPNLNKISLPFDPLDKKSTCSLWTQIERSLDGEQKAKNPQRCVIL